MAEQNDGNPAIAKAYVREMLEMNPMWESATILRRRRELWTGDGQPSSAPTPGAVPGAAPLSAVSSSATPADQQADRRREERARRSLETLQGQFYQLPEDKLRQHIEFLSHDRLPEFAAVAKRLKMVAQHRDTLLRIHKAVDDGKFTYSLLHGLVAPAAKAGSLKEQYIEAIIAERRVKPSCEMVRGLVKQYPQIHELERNWLDLFLDKQNQKQWVTQYLVRGRRGPTAKKRELGLVGFALLIAALVIVPLVGNPNTSKTNTNRSVRKTSRFKLSTNSHSSDLSKNGEDILPSLRIDSEGSEREDASPAEMPAGMPSGSAFVIPSQPVSPLASHEEMMRRIRERSRPVLQPPILDQLDEMKRRFSTPETSPWDLTPRDRQTSPSKSFSPRLPNASGSRLPSFAPQPPPPQSFTPRSFTPGSFP